MGIREGRGRWVTMQFPADSSATFSKGDLVAFNPARTVRRYSSIQSVALGIALNASANSLPAGTVLVKVPDAADCTMWVRTLTNVAASSLSAGLPVGVASDATYTDLLDTSPGSNFSRLGILTGRYSLSPYSEAEVTPNTISWAYGAASIVTASS